MIVGSMKCFAVVAAVALVVTWMPTSALGATTYVRMPGYCMQPPPRSVGRCTIDIEGFYFDPRTNDCERYEVGGCRPVPGQSFGSREDCLATCVHRTRHIKDLYTVE